MKLPSWFGHKKDKSPEVANAAADGPDSNVILSFPGPWKERSDFIEALIKSTDGRFMFAGLVIHDTKDSDFATLTFYPREAGLGEQFKISSGNRLDDETLADIESHGSVVQIHLDVSEDQRFEDIATKADRFSQAIKNAGGYAIKIEAAGLAHSWSDWEKLVLSENPFEKCSAMVLQVGGPKDLSSFGMSQFLLPDAQIIAGDEEVDRSGVLLTFNVYQLTENPVFESGQTFQPSYDDPVFQLQFVDDERYEKDSWYFNRHGVWQLRMS